MARFVFLAALLFLKAFPAEAIDLKLPFRPGENWTVTVQYGGYCGTGCLDPYHTDGANGFYAVDFDKIGALAGSGLPILAAADGIVTFAGGDPKVGFGYYVRLDHGDGYETLYGHLKEAPTLPVSTTVHQGQQVGKLGSTG